MLNTLISAMAAAMVTVTPASYEPPACSATPEVIQEVSDRESFVVGDYEGVEAVYIYHEEGGVSALYFDHGALCNIEAPSN